MLLRNNKKSKYLEKNTDLKKNYESLKDLLEEIFTNVLMDINSQCVTCCNENIIHYSGVFWIHKGTFQVEFILKEDLYFRVISALGHEIEFEDVVNDTYSIGYKNKLDYETVFIQFKLLDEYLKMFLPKKFFGRKW